MKRLSVKWTAGLASAAMLACATVASAADRASDTKVINGVTYERRMNKGALGAGWVPVGSQPTRSDTVRRESVAGFREETDAQGRRWAYKRYMNKGALGAGWIRFRVSDTK